jgi:N-acyl-phosphatidylethanolamine-hydrolysing phospholipase D
VWDILRWKLGLPPQEKAMMPDAPDRSAESRCLQPSEITRPPDSGWRATWLGHSSFLLQGCGLNLLVDPVFAAHCSPVPLPRLRRLSPLPCTIEHLPEVHGVLISHSHYDHLDLSTLRRLGLDVPLYLPEGHAGWLKRKGFVNTIEVPWFECIQITPEVKLHSTPAQHFTARSPWDRNRGHWCGWLLDGAGCSLWHAGDSGYSPDFIEIGERFGPIDFGMIPIGAYQPRHLMSPMHMNPEEAARVFLETRCRRAVAMHWGTFRLTDEPMGEPPLRLSAALLANQIPGSDFMVGTIGQSFDVDPPP